MSDPYKEMYYRLYTKTADFYDALEVLRSQVAEVMQETEEMFEIHPEQKEPKKD